MLTITPAEIAVAGSLFVTSVVSAVTWAFKINQGAQVSRNSIKDGLHDVIMEVVGTPAHDGFAGHPGLRARVEEGIVAQDLIADDVSILKAEQARQSAGLAVVEARTVQLTGNSGSHMIDKVEIINKSVKANAAALVVNGITLNAHLRSCENSEVANSEHRDLVMLALAGLQEQISETQGTLKVPRKARTRRTDPAPVRKETS